MEIEALNIQITQLEERVRELEKQHIRDLEIIEHQAELLRLRTRSLFSRKSEQTTCSMGQQLSLFDEVELEEKQKEIEDKIEELEKEKAQEAPSGNVPEEAKAGTEEKKKRLKSRNLVNMDSLPVEVKTVKAENVPEGAVLIGHKSKTKLVYKPAQYIRVETRYECWKYTDKDGNTRFVEAADEEKDTAFGNSQFDPSVVSHIVYEKTVMGMPLYRQEQDLARQGLALSRQSMCSAIFKGYEALRPVIELIHEYVRKADNCRADETRLLIIENNGEKARLADPSRTKMSYVWLYMTGAGYKPAFAYVVGPSRKYENPAKFFGDGVGHRYLQTDDYGAYDRLANTTRVPCWAHDRRRYYSAMQDSGRESYATMSGRAVSLIDMIFLAEDRIEETLKPSLGKPEYFDLLLEYRQRTVRPLMDSFFSFIHGIDGQVDPKLALGRAVSYSLGHEELAYNFFLDGRLTLTNNAAERDGIKPLVIGRKNWMFSDTEDGAEVTCGMYTLEETALANGVNGDRYLDYLYRKLPYRRQEGFDYTKYLPWSETLPKALLIPEKHK